MKFLLIIISILTLLSACTSITPTSSSFKQADLNGDGNVSLQEWEQTGGNNLAFMAADRDHSQNLSAKEFNEAKLLETSNQSSLEQKQRENDSIVTQNVIKTLRASSDVNADAINVETYKGTVQLSGIVRTLSEKQRAEAIAKSAAGTNQIFNSIAVRN